MLVGYSIFIVIKVILRIGYIDNLCEGLFDVKHILFEISMVFICKSKIGRFFETVV